MNLIRKNILIKIILGLLIVGYIFPTLQPAYAQSAIGALVGSGATVFGDALIPGAGSVGSGLASLLGPNKAPSTSFACGSNLALGDIAGSIANVLPCTLAWFISNVLLRISGFILWICAILFNWIIQYTIVKMKSNISDFGIDGAWKVFRDVSNLFFIFVLLYIAIGTILQLEGVNVKKMLSSVIIVALLVNFSLFFTEAIIDGTNIFALAFMNEISVSGGKSIADVSNYQDNGLADAFLKPLGIGSLFAPPGYDSSGPGQATKNILPQFTNGDYVGVMVIYVTASIMMLVFGGLFLLGAILFIARFIVLIFLMVLSPLAFTGMILPQTKHMISDKWWKALWDQALFAPIYFMLTWTAVLILKQITIKQDVTLFSKDPIGFWRMFGAQGLSQTGAPAIFNFVLVAGLMIASFVIAKSMASSGGKVVQTAVNWGTSKVAGMYGRGIVRGGARLATGGRYSIGDIDEKFSNSKFGQTNFGRGLRSVTTQAAIGSKFGAGDSSIGDVDKKRKEADKKHAQHVLDSERKAFEKNLPAQRLRRREELLGGQGTPIGQIQHTENTIRRLNASPLPLTQQDAEALAQAEASLKKLRTEAQEVQENIQYHAATGVMKAATKAEEGHPVTGLRARQEARLIKENETWLGGDRNSMSAKFRDYFNPSNHRTETVKALKDKLAGKDTPIEASLKAWMASQNQGGTTPPPPTPGGAPTPHTP